MEKILDLTAGQVAGWAAIAVAVISVCIEITPIKFNPISWILGFIGKRANRELFEKVDGICNKVNTLENNFKERDAINCRIRILRFSDEIRRGVAHSEESYNQVMSDIDSYENYCKAYPEFKNNKTVVAKKRIKAEYETCLESNDFL